MRGHLQPRLVIVFLVHFIFDSGRSQHQLDDPERSFSSSSSSSSSYSDFGLDVHRRRHHSTIFEELRNKDNNVNGISGEPIFLTRGQSLTVELGDTIVLPCRIQNLADSTVLWKQGERVLSAGIVKVRKDKRIALVEHSSLRITGVDVADTGNYTCEVEWSGEPKQIKHHLEVHVPPTIEAVMPGTGGFDPSGLSGHGQMERPIEAREGSSVRLECRADGIPTPVIRWRTPNSEFPLRSGAPKKTPKGPVLHIPNVQKADAGTYICTASNGVGSMSADRIELKVLYPPEVTSSQRMVHAWPGGRADLTCIIKAQPRAIITWFFEGQRLTPDASHVIEEHDTLAALRLRDISARDLGNYSCQAENSQGRARDHIELSGKPEPAKISSSSEGFYRSTFNLTWTVRSRAPLTEVRILFRKLDQPTNYNFNGSWNNLLLRVPSPSTSSYWTHFDNDDHDSGNFFRGTDSSSWPAYDDPFGPEVHSQFHVFRDLQRSSRYEAIVQTKNQYGWSEPTTSFRFSTRQNDQSPKSFASHPSIHDSLSKASFTSFSWPTTSLSSVVLVILQIARI